MSTLFLILAFTTGIWCTFPMALEELLISVVTTGGSSFAGAAIFWYLQCPNKRCCQMHAVHQAIERDKE